VSHDRIIEHDTPERQFHTEYSRIGSQLWLGFTGLLSGFLSAKIRDILSADSDLLRIYFRSEVLAKKDKTVVTGSSEFRN